MNAPVATSFTRHERPLSVNIFDDEKSVRPSKSARPAWNEVATVLQHRERRPRKSGAMLGAYELRHPVRRDDNVVSRSLVQLDIDSVVERDGSGAVVRVTRKAPDLASIQQLISDYEWVASSSHSHDPKVGLVKYRLTMLPDRDIMPLEYRPVLEALDELLGHCLDRAAWPLSQAFYLSSCPQELEADAFCIRNSGAALPVDHLVKRGRAIIAAKSSLPLQTVPAVVQVKLPENEANVATVRAMLATIPPSIDRASWRNAAWAIASLGWTCGKQLATDWSKGCPDEWDQAEFDKVWKSFDPTHQPTVTIGTLRHMAQAQGWKGQLLTSPDAFTGRGKDEYNGRAFAAKWRGKMLFVDGVEKWLTFHDHAGWLGSDSFDDMAAAKSVLAELRSQVAAQMTGGDDDGTALRLHRHVDYTSRAPNLRAMIEMAKSEPSMSVRAEAFDADPMLLGVRNGVIDLKTGTLLSMSPQLLVSKRCGFAFDPTATCPRFEGFLAEVQPDQDHRQFLQRLAGYCLSGLTTEQVFAFLYGSGGNGKTVFIELMAMLLGDYAKKIATEMLMEHRRSPGAASPDIVALKGVRLAYAAETEEGQRLAAARVKELTGGDTLSGRVLYAKNAISFTPTHKLVIVGNHRPEIADASDGMWRRVVLVGFDQTIPSANRDRDLLTKLQAEGSGILNWALAGFRDWKRSGLRVPASITQSTAAYRSEEDVVGEWIADCCQTSPACSSLTTAIYASYHSWAVTRGYIPLANHRLLKRLKERGFEKRADKRSIGGLGLKLP